MNKRRFKLSKFMFIPAVLSIAIAGCLLLLPANNVRADGEEAQSGTQEETPVAPASIVVDDKTFTYNSENGWYEWTRTSGSNAYTYKLLTQEKINENEGALPTNDSDELLLFMLNGDVVVRKGSTYDTSKRIEFSLNNHKISYEPEVKSEIFCRVVNNTATDGYAYFGEGMITTNGAPLFVADGGRFDLSDIDLIGTATSYDKNGNRAVTRYSGDINFSNVTIDGFSSEYGGAIFAAYVPVEHDGVCVKGLTIRNCYADKGGAIYSDTNLLMLDTYIMNNTAVSNGGGVCLGGINGSIYVVSNTVQIIGNRCLAYNGGGGVYCGATGLKDYAFSTESYARIQIYGNVCGHGDDTNPDITSNLYFANRTENDMIYLAYATDAESKCGISASSFADGDKLVSVMQGFGQNSTIGDRFFCDDPDYELYLDDNMGYSYVSIRVIKKSSKAVVLTGLSLVLDGSEVGIKMQVYLPDDSYSENSKWDASLAAYGDAYFYSNRFTLKCASNSITKDGRVVTFTFPIDPADMTVPLEFSLSYDGNDVLKYNDFTVQDYADAILAHPGNYNYKAVQCVAALIRYGSATQTFFNFRTDDLADKILDYYPSVKAKIDAIDLNDTSEYGYGQIISSDDFYIEYGEERPIRLYSVSAVFGSVPSLKFYFTVADGVVPVFTDGGNGILNAKKSGDYYVLKVPLSSLKRGESVRINGYTEYVPNGDNSWDISCNGSLQAYLNLMYRSERTSENMRALAKSLIIYTYSIGQGYLWSN